LQEQIDTILDGSSVDLDQFREVVDFVESIDMENDEALLKAVTDINSSIDAEVARAEQAESDLSDSLSNEVERAEKAEAEIITMVGYENMNTYTQALWDEFGNEVANSSGQTDQANQRLVDNQGFIPKAEAVLYDGNTSYPVEIEFNSDWIKMFSDSEDLQLALTFFYENDYWLREELRYWSNIDGEVNLVNFEGWLNLRINKAENKIIYEIKNLSKGLSAEAARATEVENELAKGLAEEIERAIKAEEGIDSKIADIISNTDLSSIDSFSEVVSNLSAEEARAIDAEGVLTSDLADEIANRIDSFSEVVSNLSAETASRVVADEALTKRVDAEYYKKLVVNETPDGEIVRFTFTTWGRSSSESIFLNGLLLTEKEDYATISVSGNIAAVDFIDAPLVGDRVKAYAVYATDAVSAADITAQIAKLEMDLQESKDKMNSSKASLEGIKNYLLRTTEEMHMSRQEVISLQEQLNNTNSDGSKIQEGIAESQNLLAEAQASSADLSVSIAEYEKAIADAQANKANAEAEKAQYLADGGDDKATIDGYDSTIASANAILAESQGSLMNARAQKAVNDSMIEEFKNRLNQLKAARELLKSLEAQLDQATELYSSSQANIANAEAEVAGYTSQIVELEASMPKDNASISALREQLADLQAAFGGGAAS
jgi:predicted  nucleic acid-binding Zn-ribbon protein